MRHCTGWGFACSKERWDGPGRGLSSPRCRADAALKYNFLSDATCVDRYPAEPRFELNYHLVSIPRKEKVRLRVWLAANDPVVDSLVPVWPGANWLEREIFDLFGIRFSGHPDLRRILLYDEFQGHPLRKDYPTNLCQPRVPERKVDGTFVDER